MNRSQMFFKKKAKLIVMQMAQCPSPPPLCPLPHANNTQPCLATAWHHSPAFLPLYISAMTFVIF